MLCFPHASLDATWLNDADVRLKSDDALDAAGDLLTDEDYKELTDS